MPKYTVLQPVSYMVDGVAVHQTDREVGSVVDLDDAQAKPLVKAGVLESVVDDFLPGPIINPEPETRRRRKTGDDESA